MSASIAAASVLAKVTRDRIMAGLHEVFPAYDFLGHKGYVTPVHNAALDEHGPCAEHRFSYVNVARRCAARPGPAGACRTLVRPGRPGRRSLGGRRRRGGGAGVSAEDLEKYESDMELQLCTGSTAVVAGSSSGRLRETRTRGPARRVSRGRCS